MIEVIVLDSAVLSLATQRSGVTEADDCRRWMSQRLQSGVQILVPAIVHYETRCELLRTGKTASFARLETFIFSEPGRYLPLTDADLLRAAVLWAQVRQQGLTTADDKALDIDVILASQALVVGCPNHKLVVATSNVRHLGRFVPADVWAHIG